jgi:acyl-CoA reductase-like NAD-dependent aldehyde dehydrogenase
MTTTTARVAQRPSPAVATFLEAQHGPFVDGRFDNGMSTRPIPVVDPATEVQLAEVEACGQDGAAVAAAAAKSAFDDRRWRRLSPSERAAVLMRLADLLVRDAAFLAELESLDVGLPLTQAARRPYAAAEVLRHYAGWAGKFGGQVRDVDDSTFGFTRREPLGVVAGITAWNSPLLMAVGKLAPALTAGNTIVLKPAEQAPMSTLRLAQLVEEAGVPPGVVNVVIGGAEVGRALVEHPDVRKVHFTGSPAVGQDIHRRVAADLKRVTLELGGKSPMLVFPDADLPAAVTAAADALRSNSGQICFAGTRLLVHRSVANRFREELTARVSQLRLGPGLDPTSDLGPLVSREQQERVDRMIRAAINAGAEPLTGGAVLDGVGFFVEPTVFSSVDNSMEIARKEIFGPVVCVLEFDDEAEALAIANDSPFGLAAGLWTADLSRAHRLAAGLEAGTVWVNTYGQPSRSLPSGGFKLSGVGRENGDAWIDAYTETKAVYIAVTRQEAV